MSGPNLDGYVEVNERIAAFYERYPEGNLSCGKWFMRKVGDVEFVVYQAFAHRTPNDPKPAEGWAWEPFPGKTNFTRDSELMNAETSAWGRALAALGLEVKRSTASREEVRNRQTDEQPKPRSTGSAPSDAQKRLLSKLCNQAGVTPEEKKRAIQELGGGKFTKASASAIIEILTEDESGAKLRERIGATSDLPAPDETGLPELAQTQGPVEVAS